MPGTDAASTLPALLRRTATVSSLTNPDAGLVTERERAPWGRVLTGAEGLAARLAGLGVRPGERVGLVAGNSVAGLEMLFACGLLGAVCVPLPDARDLPAGVGTVVVVAEPGEPGSDVPGPGMPRPGPGPGPGAPSPGVPGPLPAAVRRVVVGADVPGFERVDDQPGLPAPDHVAAPDDVALVVPTSGSTGLPRGCALTHGALVGAARALGRDRFRLEAEDVLWDALPPSDPGLVVPLLAILDAGGTLVTGDPGPDPDTDAGRALGRIRDERATVVVAGPAARADALLAHPDLVAGARSVRAVFTPGEPHPWWERLPRAAVLTGDGGAGGWNPF